MRRALPALVAALVLATAPAATATGSPSYGLAPTRACLLQHGALAATTPGALSASDRTYLATLTIAAGGIPQTAYLAVGPTAAASRTALAHLRSALPLPPTPATSRTGSSRNAAWLVVSLTGTRPAPSVEAAIRSCLRLGTSPTGPTRASVLACLNDNGWVLSAAAAKRLRIPSFPAPLARTMVAAFVPARRSPQEGVVALVFVGKQPAALLSAARRVLGSLVRGSEIGSSAGAGWILAPTSNAKPVEVVEARSHVLECAR